MDKQNVHAITPELSAREVVDVLHRFYGWTVKEEDVRPLPSYEDQNFRVRPQGDDSEYVFKITRSDATSEVLEMQNDAMQFIYDRIGPVCPRVQRTIEGSSLFTIDYTSKGHTSTHLARAVTFMKGSIMARATTHTSVFEYNFGRFLGRVDAILQRFHNDAAEQRELKYWDLKHSMPVAALTHCVRDEKRRAIVDEIFSIFQRDVQPKLCNLRQSIIHNDPNDFNVLVREADELRPLVGPSDIVAIIDFGDMVHTHTIFELAIGCAYAIQRKKDPLRSAVRIITGYHSQMQLLEPELEVLYDLLRLRVAVSVTMSAVSQIANPENPYLAVSEEPGWKLLELLQPVNRSFAHYLFRQACGYESHPDSIPLCRRLRRHHRENTGVIHAVTDVDFRTITDPTQVTVFDLSPGSDDAEAAATSPNTQALQDYLFSKMKKENAVAGIGRYNENRDIYRGASFHTPEKEDEQLPYYDPEPIDSRVIHIGVDVFLPAGCPVYAALTGRVHSFANNAQKYDYGPCIILEHWLDGVQFYTLYGHLSIASLEGLFVGMEVAGGEKIGEIGPFPENGDWPTHIHFQVIMDMLGYEGDFPGVARRTQRQVWLSLCPDAALLLAIPEQWVGLRGTRLYPLLLEDDGMSPEVVSHFRRERLSSALSISYNNPLKVHRGFMQYLFDHRGREYLDCVNNVCHVGHCHPRVVNAIAQQSSLLSTNTRYLHDIIVQYAEKITRSMPGELSVCFFVCSGSEANDLAYRLATTYTKSTGIIAVGSAYHGTTHTMVNASAYKLEGKGGWPAPPHVKVVPVPDTYRGEFKRNDPEAGRKYAAHIDDATAELREGGSGVAAFYCESVLGCAGQVVLPPGYLTAAYEKVRAAGGVCVADEVQVGFGRIGSHYWGFEHQGVVPDIVTLGKPIGNGYPMAAVVTSTKIARAFETGMEYFNTFGGNTVACAVGLVVLDVIADMALQTHAKEVGDHFLQKLEALKDKHALVGDVRGLGLFIGVELVRDRTSLEPADAEASWIVNEMRENGVLLSTDGPLHNVIKIKPPLVFTPENADTVVCLLDQCLSAIPSDL